MSGGSRCRRDMANTGCIGFIVERSCPCCHRRGVVRPLTAGAIPRGHDGSFDAASPDHEDIDVMTNYWKFLLGCAGIIWLIASPASAADGSWKFEPDSRDNPILTYAEHGKTVFTIGCGRAFGLGAKYPGVAKKDGKATITISGL